MPIQTIPQHSVLVLSLPASGTTTVACDKGKSLTLTFNPAEVAFSREGSSLIISEWQGGKLAVTDFFTAKAEELPLLTLPDGDTVNSADFLASLNIDTSMAAGTPAPGPDSGGEGAYNDDPGSLLNGVERLGSVGTNAWGLATAAKETDSSSAVAHTLESGLPNTPGAPANVPNVGDGIVFSARTVLYMHDEGTGAGQTPHSARSVTAKGLQNNLGSWETAGQTAQSITAHPDNPLDVDTLVLYQEDAFGNITFSLTQAGRDWMAAHPGEDIRAYYTITGAGGASYVMQVVVSADEEFHSHDMAAAHNGSLDPGGLIYGEWHDGMQPAATTPYRVTSSHLADELTFTGDIVGGDIATGSGGDTVIIDGDMRTTRVFLGNRASGADTDTAQTGDVNTLFVGGDVASSTVYGTKGTDRVTAGTAADRVVVNDTAINTGSGAGDHVGVNGRLGVFDAGSLSGARSVNTVTVEDGVVEIHSRGDSHAVVAQSKDLGNLGAANMVANEIAAREIRITAQGGASNNYAVYAQAKNTADVVHNKLTADTVEITAVGPNAAGLWADGCTGRTTRGYNEVTGVGGDLTVSARGTGMNHALHAENGGRNIIADIAGQTTLTASGGTENTAVYAALASNRLTLGGDAVISATGNGTANHGLRADVGGSNNIRTTGWLTVTASGTAGLNAALHAVGDGISSLSALNLLQAKDAATLTASGGTANYALRAESKGQNSITANAANPNGQVSLTATGGANSTNVGISSATNGGNLVVYAEGVTVTASGGTGSANTAMDIVQSAGATAYSGNKISDTRGRVELTASGGATALGMNALGLSNTIAHNDIVRAEGVSIVAKNATTANTGMAADGGSSVENLIRNIAGDVTVTASGTGATNRGMSAANDAKNTIYSDAAVTIAAQNGLVNQAMSALAGGENAVTAYERVTLTTSGGGTRHAMYADGGRNTVTVTDPDGAVVKLTGAMESKNGGTNTIATAGGDDLVTVTGAAKGVRTGAIGSYKWSNTISTGDGNDTVAVTGGGTQIVGLRVDLGDGNNLFASSAAASPITAGNQPSTNPHLWSGVGDQIQTCDFRSGDGQDTLLFHGDLRSDTSVSSGGGGDLIAVKGTVGNSSIDAGSGHNSIVVTGSATSAKFTAGNGDDTLTIEGGASNGAGGTIINLGDGHNSVCISHGTGAGQDALTGGSQLFTGAGADDIRLIGNVGGAGTNADGVYKSSTLVNTGAGDDHILIDGAITSTGFTLLAGDGNDTLELLAVDWTEFATRYKDWIVGGGLVGAEVEHLDVWAATGTDYTDIPAWLQTAAAGAGVSLNLHMALPDLSAAVYTDPSTSYHYDNASTDVLNSIAFGNGDDNIGIGSSSDGHVLDLSNGDNALRVAGDIGASTVSFGGDHDTLTVGGDIQGAFIDLKAGNDVFIHNGVHMTGVVLDGGSNDAVVHAAADGGDSRLGDILGFGGDALGNMDTTLASGAGNTITGFETLLADSSNGTADSIHLDNLLNAAHTLNTDGNDIQTLIIRGDGDDTFSFDGLSAMQEARDVHINGMDGLYTLYSVDDGGQELRVYLQTLVQAG